MSLYTLRPISDRTPFTGKHVESPFDSTWGATRQLLAQELRAIKAKNVVLEVDFRERDLRQDGELRADAKCQSPAIRLAFDSMHGPLIYATDKFVGRSYRRRMDDWQHNVRAVALGLEALRKVDRYGISARGEQYRGYLAITAGTTAIGGTASAMTRETALKVIAEQSGFALEHLAAGSADLVADAIQRARKRTHPDKHNGDDGWWNAVEVARKVLEASA